MRAARFFSVIIIGNNVSDSSKIAGILHRGALDFPLENFKPGFSAFCCV